MSKALEILKVSRKLILKTIENNGWGEEKLEISKHNFTCLFTSVSKGKYNIEPTAIYVWMYDIDEILSQEVEPLWFRKTFYPLQEIQRRSKFYIKTRVYECATSKRIPR